jgi:hypothetical protein
MLIGGRFNDDGGAPSGVIRKIESALSRFATEKVCCINGGRFDELESALEYVASFDVVLWFADVPNDKEKLLARIKPANQACMLVTSKNNLDGTYTPLDLVSRALAAKANLLVEFTRKDGGFAGSIHDPLGNLFLEQETNLDYLVATLVARLSALTGFSRIGSQCIGSAPVVPEQTRFFEIVRQRAERFHELIHAVNPTRFLGNASFRCENGFPSFRDGQLIYVSRRNVDKRLLGAEAFVAVKPGRLREVEYYGEHKPSVDTPVQLCLYNYYQRVNFMIHSHTYIEGAPFTGTMIPCGAVEEAAEVIRLHQDEQAGFVAVNLRGHGSLALASEVGQLDEVKYYSRPMPEKSL